MKQSQIYKEFKSRLEKARDRQKETLKRCNAFLDIYREPCESIDDLSCVNDLPQESKQQGQ